MSHKRKHDGQLLPVKKHRQENTQHSSISKSTQAPPGLPLLPYINSEHETLVFTHQGTVGSANDFRDTKSYERLEFLGDAYIEVIATRLLWNQFKDMPTGKLSKTRENLVKNETLAQFSVSYGFDKRLRKPEDFAKNLGPSMWTKVKGDVFEAYVAAVVLSDPINGFEAAEDWLTQLWLPILKDVSNTKSNLRAKEELAKMILGKDVKLNYVDERSAIHNRKGGMETYFVGVYLTGWGWTNQHLGSGTGLNKVVAGNDAAGKAMENKPLIDEIVEKRRVFYEKKKEQEQK